MGARLPGLHGVVPLLASRRVGSDIRLYRRGRHARYFLHRRRSRLVCREEGETHEIALVTDKPSLALNNRAIPEEEVPIAIDFFVCRLGVLLHFMEGGKCLTYERMLAVTRNNVMSIEKLNSRYCSNLKLTFFISSSLAIPRLPSSLREAGRIWSCCVLSEASS